MRALIETESQSHRKRVRRKGPRPRRRLKDIHPRTVASLGTHEHMRTNVAFRLARGAALLMSLAALALFPAAPSVAESAPVSASDTERRIAELERKIEELQKELGRVRPAG